MDAAEPVWTGGENRGKLVDSKRRVRAGWDACEEEGGIG